MILSSDWFSNWFGLAGEKPNRQPPLQRASNKFRERNPAGTNDKCP